METHVFINKTKGTWGKARCEQDAKDNANLSIGNKYEWYLFDCEPNLILVDDMGSVQYATGVTLLADGSGIFKQG